MSLVTAHDPAWPATSASTRYAEPVDAVVLAGDRRRPDPVAQAAGTPCKVMATVAGRPMLERVHDALAASGAVARTRLCGPARDALTAAPSIEQALADQSLIHTQACDSPSASVASALAADNDGGKPVLITTGDHALLTASMVSAFTSAVAERDWDAAAAVVPSALVTGRYPEARPTATRFQDAAVCGCNLFSLNTPASRRLIDLWTDLEQRRKQPWRTIMGAVGLRSLLAYGVGRLTLERTLTRLSHRLGIRVGAVLLPFAAAGLDVDTVADWHLADRIARGAY